MAAIASAPKRKSWDIPPLWFVIAIALMVALDWFVPIAQPISWPWSLAGSVLVVAGIVLAVVAERRFKRAGTAVRPFEPSTALVEDGPFRITRNPMYLGMILVLAGVFILLGSLSPLLVLPAFAWLLHARFVVHEEAHMERHFGARYLAYQRRVRRWF
jgi:protein-S-isoprenylcysteine O-methyltransferase Ste14